MTPPSAGYDPLTTGTGLLHCGLEGWGCPQMSGHMPGVVDRKTGMGVLWCQTAERKGTICLVELLGSPTFIYNHSPIFPITLGQAPLIDIINILCRLVNGVWWSKAA